MAEIMRKFKVILVVLLIFSCNDSEQSKKEKVAYNKFNKLTKFVDIYANDIIKKGNVNSLAVAIYKDGKMYQNYYGEIDKGTSNKPNDNSLFEIASITKTFTGSLVAKAVLEGKISLDDDIRKYLEGEYLNLEFEGQPITIKCLLTHSMGLKNKLTKGFEDIRNKVTNGSYDFRTDFYDIDDLLEELKTVEVNEKPGTVYAYNSLGSELLAHILEKVHEKPFKEQMNVFFRELGMYNTYLNKSQEYKGRLVNGYKGDELAPLDFDPVYGAAGGAISTLPDLAIYMKYLVDNKNEPWVKESSRLLFEDKEEDEQVGYLWQNIGFAQEEGYYYSKTGTSNRVQSGVLICPDSNYGIIVMANNTSEKAQNDWLTLFFSDIEPDVIKYPRLNLFSFLKSEFPNDLKTFYAEFNKRRKDTLNYFLKEVTLNNFGYELLNKGFKKEAINVFNVYTEVFPNNANAYDSLGEAFFIVEDYKKALINFKKALELNPEMETSKDYIKKIKDIIKQQS